MWHTEHTLETTASPDAIWKRWMDVEHWPDWDHQMEWAHLRGPLRIGSMGVIKGRNTGRVSVVVIAMEEGRAFTMLGKRLLATLRMVHRLEPSQMGSKITHRVEVVGPMAWLFQWIRARRLRDNLPRAVRMLARLAHKT